MSLALYPSIKLGATEQKIRRSISRLTTGLNILAGGTSGDFAQGIEFSKEARSNKAVVSTTQVGLDLLRTAESALVELAALATRLREIGIADTNSTNSASDTAALNAEAISVSDSIDDIVSTLKFHSVALLGTSDTSFNIVKNLDGETTSVKTTAGITATNITDATNSNTTADTALTEINQNKKANEPWAYSLMLSYGDTKQVTNVTITTTNKTWSSSTKNYQTQSYQNALTDSSAGGLVMTYAFSPIQDKDSKSLYVYNNDKLLIMNQDYVITNASDNRIVFVGANKPDVGDKVRIEFFDKKQDVIDLIDVVLSDLEKNKFINDKFYSESKAKSMIQRGNSINKIRNYLIGKGINNEFIKQTVAKIQEDNNDQDFFSAIKICKKKRIGPARDENNRPLFMKKDLGILARSGFDFDTSKRVLDIDKEEYLKIINLL